MPKDVGIEHPEVLLRARVGAAFRLDEKTVFSAGYGITKNPLPWSRPMRGSFPYDITLTPRLPAPTTGYDAGARASRPSSFPTQLGQGRPAARRLHPLAQSEQVDRGTVQQWNIAVERRLPGDISVEWRTSARRPTAATPT